MCLYCNTYLRVYMCVCACVHKTNSNSAMAMSNIGASSSVKRFYLSKALVKIIIMIEKSICLRWHTHTHTSGCRLGVDISNRIHTQCHDDDMCGGVRETTNQRKKKRHIVSMAIYISQIVRLNFMGKISDVNTHTLEKLRHSFPILIAFMGVLVCIWERACSHIIVMWWQ